MATSSRHICDNTARCVRCESDPWSLVVWLATPPTVRPRCRLPRRMRGQARRWPRPRRGSMMMRRRRTLSREMCACECAVERRCVSSASDAATRPAHGSHASSAQRHTRRRHRERGCTKRGARWTQAREGGTGMEAAGEQAHCVLAHDTPRCAPLCSQSLTRFERALPLLHCALSRLPPFPSRSFPTQRRASLLLHRPAPPPPPPPRLLLRLPALMPARSRSL